MTMHSNEQTTFFSWDPCYRIFGRKIGNWIGLFLERILKITHICNIYSQHKHLKCAYDFNREIINAFDLRIHDASLTKNPIPTKGPLIIVANHPFGACEALLLLNWLASQRPDVKFIANFLLAKLTPLDQVIIQVNPFNNKPNAKNTGGLREAIKWLKQEHALILFPSGEVSRFSFKNMKVSDGQWNPQIIRLAKLTQATIVPVFVHGRNSFLFHVLSVLHKTLGLLLLPRELLRRVGQVTSISVGQAIRIEDWQGLKQEEEQIHYLRQCLESLNPTFIPSPASGRGLG